MRKITQEQLREIKERVRRATAAPWVVPNRDESDLIWAGPLKKNKGGITTWPGAICQMTGAEEFDFDQLFDEYMNGDAPRDEDGEPLDLSSLSQSDRISRNWPWDRDFITHARTDIPRLLSALESARAERDALKAEIDAAMKDRERLTAMIENGWYIARSTINGERWFGVWKNDDGVAHPRRITNRLEYPVSPRDAIDAALKAAGGPS